MGSMPTLQATAGKPQAQTGNSGNKAPAPVVPFTRAARKMSRMIGQYNVTPGTTVVPLNNIPLPAAGFMRFLRLTVTGTTAGNAATVTFKNDAPFNLLNNVSVQTANGDALTSPLDGFLLYVINKYLALGSGRRDPVADPAYSVTAGSGATGGSFKFQIRIPFEIDTRDAFGALENMAANQSYLLQMSALDTGHIYGTAPTTPPNVTIRAVMEYWAAPNATTTQGIAQQIAPNGDGSVNLLQTAQPPVVAGTNQSIQLPNVGNTVRALVFILRDSSGVRDSADWPDISTFYQNGQPLMLKTKDNWLTQMAEEYNITGGVSATPAVNTLDTGVFVVTDFMNDGGSGNGKVDGGANRDLLLVTGSQTALNFEATSNWGATAGTTLQVLTNAIRPSSPQALYPPVLI